MFSIVCAVSFIQSSVCLKFTFSFPDSSRSFSSNEKTCIYELFDLKPDASHSDIKKAYFSKSKKYHPDLNDSKDAVQMFQEINLAYGILSDKNKREEYDYDNGHKIRSK